jgi:hypothetical protein
MVHKNKNSYTESSAEQSSYFNDKFLLVVQSAENTSQRLPIYQVICPNIVLKCLIQI